MNTENTSNTGKQQLFGKRSALYLLIIGSLLTAFFQFTSYQYDHHDRHKHEKEVMAYDLFNSLSLSMGKRLYQMRRCIWALGNNQDPEIFNERWELYQETLKEWNYQLQRNQACVKYCFGKEMLKTFVHEIQADFGTLHDLIRGKTNLAKAEELANKLYKEIDNFGFEMMERTWDSGDHEH